MTMLVKIEEDIKNLPDNEFSQLRQWFQDFESKRWDKQIENDINSGKLDDLAKNAINDFKNGKFKTI